MKKNSLVLAIFAVAVLFSTQLTAQKFSKLDKSPMDAASFPSDYKESNKVVKVVYSRPQLKGRTVASLAPAGKVWRTGANEAVEITFYKDVTFGGKAVKAGTYTLFTIPGDKEWTVILSSACNVWGSYFYKESEDIVRVPGKVSVNEESVEAFSIAFDKDMNLHMAWGNIIVSVSVK
jgi:hypothetical protein